MIKRFHKKSPQQGQLQQQQQAPQQQTFINKNSSFQNEAAAVMTSSAAGGNSHVQKNAEAELGKAAGGLRDAKLPIDSRLPKDSSKDSLNDSRDYKMEGAAKGREPMKASNNVMTSQKQTKSDQQPAKGDANSPKMADIDDAEQARLSKLFNFNENSRMTRNLSISRSGRHKMKKQQRLSVVEGEMFNSPDKNCGSDVAPTSPLSISGPATMV